MLNGLNVMSALVYEPAAHVVAYHASVWVHEQSLEWMRSVFSSVTAMQAAMANVQGELLASIVGGEPATSDHPISGTRTVGDDMLNINQAVVGPAGQTPSQWAGDDRPTLASARR